MQGGPDRGTPGARVALTHERPGVEVWTESKHSEDGLTRADLWGMILENPAYHELAAFSDALTYIQPRDLIWLWKT